MIDNTSQTHHVSPCASENIGVTTNVDHSNKTDSSHSTQSDSSHSNKTDSSRSTQSDSSCTSSNRTGSSRSRSNRTGLSRSRSNRSDSSYSTQSDSSCTSSNRTGSNRSKNTRSDTSRKSNRPDMDLRSTTWETGNSRSQPRSTKQRNHDSYTLQLTPSNESSIQEIAYNVRDAVVAISGQYHRTPHSDHAESDGNVDIVHGNGFFIKGHYIICPASLVLVSPVKYPTGVHRQTQAAINRSLTKYPNTITRMTRIIVAVSNVNGCGKSYSYEADIVGVDGSSNIAVLYINGDNGWNTSSPPIRSCHPFLNWGKSRNSCPGDVVILIGEVTGFDRIGLTRLSVGFVSENGVSVGNIADNRYVSYGGSVPGELLLLSNIMPLGDQTGLPVITTNGTVIGMYLHVENSKGLNIALSEFFMRRPLKALIRSFIDNKIPDSYRGFVDVVHHQESRASTISSDADIDHPASPGNMDIPFPGLDNSCNFRPYAGNSYYCFSKSCLGLGGVLMTQDDYITNFDRGSRHTSQPGVFLQRSHASVSQGDTTTCGSDSQVNIRSDGDDSCKEIVGYRILAIAGPVPPSDANDFFIPGTPPLTSQVPVLPSSPLYGVISVGDIITHVNCCPIGDRKGQISPALIMWRVRPGDNVTILYRKQIENFKTPHEITVQTYSYSPFLDFPWYAVPIPETLQNMFPVIM